MTGEIRCFGKQLMLLYVSAFSIISPITNQV